MKNTLLKKIAALGMFAVLGIASVGTVVSFADTTVTASEAKPERPERDGRYMGRITEIDSSSITIEMMGGPMGHGQNQSGVLGGKGKDQKGTPPELPTNEDGTAMTPPERPANEDGTFTPPEPPKNEEGTPMAPPEGEQKQDEKHESRTMTFATSSNYVSEFSVGDMVEVLSADGETADSVSTAERPEKKNNE